MINCWAFEDKRVTIETRDIQSYRGEHRQYDCIVVDLLDPDASQADLWQTLLTIVKSWIRPGGSIVINAGGITPWQTDTLNWLLQHVESKPPLWRHLYKVFVPSFAREWCFLLLSEPKVIHLDKIPPNVKYIDTTAWHQAYTYGWTKNYVENLHGI
jgi:predicted membrane-bound spermidine synthase